MISYQVYQLVHFTGIFMLMVSLGGMMLHMINGGTRNHSSRKRAAMTHGIGMLLVLVGGFGMLARLGIVQSLPGWIHAKLAIWLVFGGVIALVYRKPALNRGLWWLLIALGVTAAWLAGTKPF